MQAELVDRSYGARAMDTEAVERGNQSGDTAAIATIIAVALLALAISWLLPWWVMKAKAPQYGQRTLFEIGRASCRERV